MLHSLFVFLGFLTFFITLLPYLRIRHWIVRSFDFPLLQIAIISAVIALIQLLFVPSSNVQWLGFMASLVATVIQAKRIYPWTSLSPKSVTDSVNPDTEDQITFLVSNVLTPNREAPKLIALVEQYQPDILLTLESDKWWGDQLDSAVSESMPYSVKVPLDNLYGMHLYSKLELEDTKTEWLIQDDIPSVHTWVKLKNGERIKLHALHPRPPAPGESDESLWRDAELLLVGKVIAENQHPTIVAGDLNDVAWSRTTKLFCKVSHMLDLRRGRGQYSTFHAKYPLLRWPLDHVFVSKHFALVNMQRLSEIGSDHFPVLVTLSYSPENASENNVEEATSTEKKDAQETIKEASDRHGENPT